MKKQILKSVNARSFRLQESDKETPKGLSRTVPGETLSIRQIVDRFTRGNPAIGKVNPVTWLDVDHDDPDYEAISRMDLDDLAMLKERVSQDYEDARVRLRDLKLAEEIAKKAEASGKAKDDNPTAAEEGAKK